MININTLLTGGLLFWLLHTPKEEDVQAEPKKAPQKTFVMYDAKGTKIVYYYK